MSSSDPINLKVWVHDDAAFATYLTKIKESDVPPKMPPHIHIFCWLGSGVFGIIPNVLGTFPQMGPVKEILVLYSQGDL